MGTWEHLEVPGHPPTDVWQKFTLPNGQWQAWNQGHLGEVIEMRGGRFVDVGKCPICKGSTRVSCATCQGRGDIECPLCKGVGEVAANVRAPDEIPLKDGRVLRGKIVVQRGDVVQVRTTDGKTVTLHQSELAPR